MARAPSAGGKSRLASAFPAADIASLRTALLLDAIGVAVDSGFSPHVFVTPDSATNEVSSLARSVASTRPGTGARVHVHPQGDGDLGARMRSAIESLIRSAYTGVIVIGTDVPLLTADDLRGAAALVDDMTIALGPARDGGYYLLATTRGRPELFDEMNWGTSEVFESTASRAHQSGCRVERLRPLCDLDTGDDLDSIRAALESAPASIAPAFRRWLATRSPHDGDPSVCGG